jgi:DNA-dependent RNA polymerase auxiliary subunit epsilon
MFILFGIRFFKYEQKIQVNYTKDTRNFKIMKKHSSICADCGDDSSILTQVSSGPEVTLLCSDCYNLKYLKEVHDEIGYFEKEKN